MRTLDYPRAEAQEAANAEGIESNVVESSVVDYSNTVNSSTVAAAYAETLNGYPSAEEGGLLDEVKKCQVDSVDRSSKCKESLVRTIEALVDVEPDSIRQRELLALSSVC